MAARNPAECGARHQRTGARERFHRDGQGSWMVPGAPAQGRTEDLGGCRPHRSAARVHAEIVAVDRSSRPTTRPQWPGSAATTRPREAVHEVLRLVGWVKTHLLAVAAMAPDALPTTWNAGAGFGARATGDARWHRPTVTSLGGRGLGCCARVNSLQSLVATSPRQLAPCGAVQVIPICPQEPSVSAWGIVMRRVAPQPRRARICKKDW